MNLSDAKEITILGKDVKEIYINGNLAWEKFVDPGMTILKFNGGSGIKTLNIANIEKIPGVENIMIDTGDD